jgi:hypothetical protein
MTTRQPHEWESFWSDFESLRTSVARVKAVNVNSNGVRQAARDLVHRYFNATRPALPVDHARLEVLDSQIQRLLLLSNGRNAKRSYADVLRRIHRARGTIDVERVRAIGGAGPQARGRAESGLESAIASTLEEVVPSAALSYRQALVDLRDTTRLSYRGPATDLRESLRELLDHLAPDKEVRKTPNFKLEPGRTGPTMKQKVRFILASRGLGKTAIETPEASVERIDEALGVLARSVYNRGSVSTHVATARTEVLQLKVYAEAVLVELLQIHARS